MLNRYLIEFIIQGQHEESNIVINNKVICPFAMYCFYIFTFILLCMCVSFTLYLLFIRVSYLFYAL